VIAQRTQIIRTILPELDPRIGDVESWAARVDRAAVRVRLAAMLVPLADPITPETCEPRTRDQGAVAKVAEILRALKFSNDEINLGSPLVGVARASQIAAWTPAEVRRLLAQLDRNRRAAAVELWASEAQPNDTLVTEARRVLAAQEPLAIGDLAVTGKDVMTALELAPGPAVGRILALLLDRVLEDPARNTRETLLAAAQQLELEVGH
jgi:hypothetical protein